MGNLQPGGAGHRLLLIARLKQLQGANRRTGSLGLFRLFQIAYERSAAALGACHRWRVPHMAKELFLLDKRMEIV